MARKSRVEEESILGRLEGVPVRKKAETAGARKATRAKRVAVYDLGGKEQEAALYPVGLLRDNGVELPEFDKNSILVSTSPSNYELRNEKDDVASFIIRGNKIEYSINGSPRRTIGGGEIEVA
ncbi:hypothetical protein GF415_05000 [Candidatus Micrarchaeota archaeon]|nr:hypothetical protein [Candidatus Micrarchaeota archaeon]